MKQMELPLERPPMPRASREAERLYAAVLFLRRSGRRVARISRRQHRVDGLLLSPVELIQYARHIKLREEMR